MPTCKQVSKKPAGVICKKPAAGCGIYRPVFKTGDIAMKAVFDSGVPFSNGVYAAVVTLKCVGMKAWDSIATYAPNSLTYSNSQVTLLT